MEISDKLKLSRQLIAEKSSFLSEWEIDFIESLNQQFNRKRTLSLKQVYYLDRILEDKILKKII